MVDSKMVGMIYFVCEIQIRQKYTHGGMLSLALVNVMWVGVSMLGGEKRKYSKKWKIFSIFHFIWDPIIAL